MSRGGPAYDGAWLVAIDLQRAFTSPPGPWASSGYAAVEPRVHALLAAYAGRTVLTRFVPPPRPEGSWVDYYTAWPFALEPDAAPGWDLVVEPGDAPVLTRPTMGKYGPDLLAATGGVRDLVLCGVSTECCVVATALAAADDGARVRVVGDACAGAGPQEHEQALGVLRGFAPQVTVTSTADLLG